ncbi:Lipid-binding protein [Limihaloglobus sulfuriphilus]|uniref:ATP synthase subunit c n=2 Tax=Limihaloglobus sulfuriphilus TaxID=1851148 RepID=A0A1Q2MI17_9BACT|nr:ATP synthase F0 subunit C [Limihaloglobus sulfuriphilus]AQQ72168.1 Lipid-binding protein [Limihaloglobus sulfuriphilus]
MLNMLSTIPMMTAVINIELNDKGLGMLAGLIACGLIVIGAGKGIGNLAGKATEAISRQPEAGGRIFTAMLVAASFIEGIALFALVICLVAILFG